MKPIFLILAFMLSIYLLSGCAVSINETPPAPTVTTETETGSPVIETKTETDSPADETEIAADSPSVTDSPEITDSPGESQKYYFVREARGVLQAWVDSHPFQLSGNLELEYDDYAIGSAEYFRFYLGIERFGVAEILVQKETGELFHLESPGNTTFEPLNDWYDKNHSPELYAFLTEAEARETAQAWLDNHPIKEPNILENEYDNAMIDGEEYYAFYIDSHEMYWFSILVHKETGALLCRVRSDGEFPEEDIEPLDDWYDRYYS